jgi:hypothetical protein
MAQFLMILAVTLPGLVPVTEGEATRYNPGIMTQVVENRVKWGHIDLDVPHFGYVALSDKGYIGERAWIEWPDGRLTGPYLVADCGARHDLPALDAKGFAVDLSWELAVQFGVIDAPLSGVAIYIEEGGFFSKLYQQNRSMK